MTHIKKYNNHYNFFKHAKQYSKTFQTLKFTKSKHNVTLHKNTIKQ